MLGLVLVGRTRVILKPARASIDSYSRARALCAAGEDHHRHVRTAEAGGSAVTQDELNQQPTGGRHRLSKVAEDRERLLVVPATISIRRLLPS